MDHVARQMTPLDIATRLEWRYDRIGNREGTMCPVCYQFRPREKPLRTKWYRANYGRKAMTAARTLDAAHKKTLARLRVDARIVTALLEHGDKSVARERRTCGRAVAAAVAGRMGARVPGLQTHRTERGVGNMWQVTVVEGVVVTRIAIGCEAPAREMLARLLARKYNASLRVVDRAPERGADEQQRVEALMEIIFGEGGNDGATIAASTGSAQH